jgi:hypothetical protein
LSISEFNRRLFIGFQLVPWTLAKHLFSTSKVQIEIRENAAPTIPNNFINLYQLTPTSPYGGENSQNYNFSNFSPPIYRGKVGKLMETSKGFSPRQKGNSEKFLKGKWMETFLNKRACLKPNEQAVQFNSVCDLWGTKAGLKVSKAGLI